MTDKDIMKIFQLEGVNYAIKVVIHVKIVQHIMNVLLVIIKKLIIMAF